MLDYGWGQPSSIMLSSGSGEETTTGHHQVDPEPPRAAVFDPYHNFSSSNFINTSSETHFSNSGHHLPFLHNNNPNHFTTLYGGGASSSSSYPHPQPMLTLEPGFMMVPKSEPMAAEFNSRIGLNLGGRTYFASSEDDFVNRLYRRTRMLDPAAVRCQAEGCNSDLSHAKHYHRRHKVCEFHSKAATVIAAGLTQRFCQQCSRFHLLSEFDNGKRSCRKRLADHNRRRRKTQQTTTTNNNNNQDTSNNNTAGGGPTSSYQNIPNSGSSVTVAISPPTISLDCYGGHASSSTASTNSLFYANG